MLRFLLECIFPVRSLDGRYGAGVVTAAERRLLRSDPLRIDGGALRRRGMRAVDRLVAATTYARSPLLREMLRRYKYRAVRALEPELTALLVPAIPLLPVTEAVVSPVPLHWTRRFLRGFNQAEVLAESVAAVRGWECRALLTRVRPTGMQALRAKGDRRRALAGAFRVVRGAVIPPRVLLVDDVTTTGATLEACAAALKRAGAVRVDAIVLAVA